MKCLKYLNSAGLQTYDDAIKLRLSNDYQGALLNIESEEEQQFLSDMLFKNENIVENVWIRAKIIDISLGLKYSNWKKDEPIYNTEYDCIEMVPDSNPPGKWVNKPRSVKNIVVCEKKQSWSQEKLLQSYIEFETKIEKLFNNLLPIGFIYVQLPNQDGPGKIWPGYKWTDVSSIYAGQFFRVVGGNVGQFGEIQEESCPQITKVNDVYINADHNHSVYPIVLDKPVSNRIFTAWETDINPHGSEGLTF